MSRGVSSSTKVIRWKVAFRTRLVTLLNKYPKFLIINAENVGSRQLQTIRQALRGKAEILMGKNTMFRKAIHENVDKIANLDQVLPFFRGNTGLVFTHLEVEEVRSILLANKVQRAAKAGAVSPVDVIIPAGNTNLEPTKTSFFQALSIPSKISRGSISLDNNVHLLRKGQRVSHSQAALLQMLKIRPFHYGLKTGMVYDNGDIYPSAPIHSYESDSDLFNSVMTGIRNVAALSLEIGYPTQASLAHSRPQVDIDIPTPAVDGDDDEYDVIYGIFDDDDEDLGFFGNSTVTPTTTATTSVVPVSDNADDEGGDDECLANFFEDEEGLW